MAVTRIRNSYINALSVFSVLRANALAVVVKDAQAVDAKFFREIGRLFVQSGQLAVDVSHYHCFHASGLLVV